MKRIEGLIGKKVFSEAKYPLFNFADIETRAMVAISLGCDVIPGCGVSGAGAGKIWLLFLEFTEDGSFFKGKFKASILKKLNCSEDVLDAYIFALKYEPCNSECDHGNFQYLDGRPIKIPNYLSDFVDDQSIVYPGAETCVCVGVSENTHTFLKHEGSFVCNSCQGCVCVTCVCKLGEGTFCLKCFSQNLCTQSASDDEDGDANANHKNSDEMRTELIQAGFDIGAQTTDIDLQEIYESYIIKNSVNKFRDSETAFPVFPAKDLGGSIGTHILEFNLQEGGRFIGDDRVCPINLSRIFDLYSSLVSFDYKKYTSFESEIYQALPTILVDFAYWSRIGTGYRLLKRSARHVVDPNMADISDVTCRLFSYNNEVGLEFGSNVAASMKGCTYYAQVAFTPTKLLCCGCSCPIGAENNERITCVHNLPLVLKQSLLLMDGLAENLLLELLKNSH